PDLLYTDGAIPFEQYGLSIIAHLYNKNARKYGGRSQAVFTSKHRTECATGMCVLDLERGVAEKLLPNVWQTDTCVGNWHYHKQQVYKTPKRVVDMLVDIVSRNGNLLLNFPLPNSGALDTQELSILSEITKWMAVNGEAIYSSRPWKTFGEGPGTAPPPSNARFNEQARQDLTPADVRFTTRGKALYAFVMGVPDKEAVIKALGTGSSYAPGKIENVELLGHKGKVSWIQEEGSLTVQMPPQSPSAHVVTFKIAMA
ncbi:MAG TPA: alpha-L-fucosidase, partial [Bryobacteraceae bacterium]|nr:alpha-L-fucosidase [Bryobacteraceae bacterium]